MIEGLSHMTFVTSDIERFTTLMVDALGASVTYDSGADQFSISRERFFDLNGIWIAAMEGDPLSSRTYNHIAFKIAEDDYEELMGKIKAMGFDLRPPRPRVEGEGRSIYFYDHDNHMFELHTGTLQDRLARYAMGREAAA
jgi:catechol 2,3-dioxygenase-like lactoylglutathione lyase family enzyme